jgi:hypothetical protein
MERFWRLLLLPASEIFSGFDCNNGQWVTCEQSKLPTAFREIAQTDYDWNLFVSHCEAVLKAEGFQPSPNSIARVAGHVARVSSNAYRAGLAAGAYEYTKERANSARAAKRQKADGRGRILRQAILAVCAQENIWPTASEKFAASIQAEVIEAARQLGLTDIKSGTSSRSIQRHIAALLKHDGMP